MHGQTLRMLRIFQLVLQKVLEIKVMLKIQVCVESKVILNLDLPRNRWLERKALVGRERRDVEHLEEDLKVRLKEGKGLDEDEKCCLFCFQISRGFRIRVCICELCLLCYKLLVLEGLVVALVLSVEAN